MSYLQLAYFHLATVLPAFGLGTYLMLRRKGTPLHKWLGKIYLALMFITASISLCMPAHIGPQVLGHFGFIHIFSLVVLYSVPSAYLAARRHDVRSHKLKMIGVYVGGLLITGGFAFMPGRLLHMWLFGA